MMIRFAYTKFAKYRNFATQEQMWKLGKLFIKVM